MQILFVGSILFLKRLIECRAHCTCHFCVVACTFLVQAELVENLVETCTLGHLASECIRQQNVVSHLLHLIGKLAHRTGRCCVVDERQHSVQLLVNFLVACLYPHCKLAVRIVINPLVYPKKSHIYSCEDKFYGLLIILDKQFLHLACAVTCRMESN